MGKASWDARVTGLGPRDVPENDRKCRVGQSVVDAAVQSAQQAQKITDIPLCRNDFFFVITRKEVSD